MNKTDNNQDEALPTIACILVNYCTPREMLFQCLDSIIGSCEGLEPAIVIVDNASGDGVVDQVASAYPGIAILKLTSNDGFAAAVNAGLQRTDADYVLMLNTDAVITDGALDNLVAVLDRSPKDCAGVAPKMMSSTHAGLIDAIGTVMPPNGASFSRGIGQCDLGQYDRQEEVSGVCFGAALLRRELFEPSRVGPLYEGYFLYFEDSDWCMRAMSQGYRFITVPEAVVLHMHSGVTRQESLDFKYKLIELNTLKIVTRTFASSRHAGRVVLSRLARLLARTFIRRRHVSANLSIMASYLSALPSLIRERHRLKARRIASDARVFQMAAGEGAWFDTTSYGPDRCLDSLIDTYQRLMYQKRDPGYEKLLDCLNRMKARDEAGQEPILDDEAAALFAEEPVCVQKLLEIAARR